MQVSSKPRERRDRAAERRKRAKRTQASPVRREASPSHEADRETEGEGARGTDLELMVGPPASLRRPFRIGLAVTAVAIVAFYGLTVCRWIGLGDTALLLDEIVELKINSHVNNHSLAILFGHLFSRLPFGELALRVNLMSVLFGSIAVVLAYMVAFRTLQRLVPALVATGAIAVMHSMWWHSTIVENYAINAVAVIGVLLLLLKDEEREDWKFYSAACVVAGLGMVNHVQNGILAVAVFVYSIVQRRKDEWPLWRRWVSMTAYFLIGFAPYLGSLIGDMVRAGDPMKVVYWAIGGDFTSRMFDVTPAKVFRPLLRDVLIQFPSPMLVFVGLGIANLRERPAYRKTTLAMGAAFAINTLFFATFHTWDKFAFLLPSFLVLSYWGILGMKVALEWAEARARAGKGALRSRAEWARHAVLAVMLWCVALPPLVYRAFPDWGVDEGFWHHRFNNNFTINSHDAAAYIANPNKAGWNDVDVFAKLLFEKLPLNAIYIDDDARLYYPIHDYYQKRLGYRPDLRVLLINSWGFSGWGLSESELVQIAKSAMGRRSVFVVSIQHPHVGLVGELAKEGIVARRFELDDEHWVYRLEKVTEPAPLHVHDMYTGRGFDRATPVLKSRFSQDEGVATEVRFAASSEPVKIAFTWVDPSGASYFTSDPFVLEPNNTSVWSVMGQAGPRPPGRWTVKLEAEGQTLGSASFEIR